MGATSATLPPTNCAQVGAARRAILHSALLVMKYIFRDDLPEHLRDIFPPLRELSSPVARMSIQAR